MQQIVPTLWFDDRIEEAMEFYTSVFPDSRIVHTSHYPAEGLPDSQLHLAGRPQVIHFTLLEQHFTALNGGSDAFSPTPANSFFVGFDTGRDPQAREHLDRLWAALLDGGQVLIPLDTYPFSEHYGWVQDRYGYSWQLMLGNPEGDWRPIIVPSLMFSDSVQNRATEALEHYTQVFPNSRPGLMVPYTEQSGPARPGALMYGDAKLADTWFAAMDSAVEQDFTFTPAVSYSVLCEDQEEIDQLWSKLSEVPEAEACGWCQDRFGVSWQIVPANIEQLLQRPGAYQNMLQMKKLVIDEF